MTEYGLAASVVWAAVAVYGLWRAEKVLAGRWVSVVDYGSNAKSNGSTSGGSLKVEIPNDLEALAMAESEPWARDELRLTIREKQAELGGDWQGVRRAMGIGELP